jgi:hypothetical protein
MYSKFFLIRIQLSLEVVVLLLLFDIVRETSIAWLLCKYRYPSSGFLLINTV